MNQVWDSIITAYYNWIVEQRMFDPEASLFLGMGDGGALLTQGKDGPKFRIMEEEEKFNQSLVNKDAVPIDPWGQAVQLIIYEAGKGILRILVWPCHRKVREVSTGLTSAIW